MSDKDVYEQWKAKRSSIAAPSGFESKVMTQVTELSAPKTERKTERKPTVLERPLCAAVAIAAASIFGLLRIGFALLFAISS